MRTNVCHMLFMIDIEFAKFIDAYLICMSGTLICRLGKSTVPDQMASDDKPMVELEI